MDQQVVVRTPNITLEGYPGERATWTGRIVLLAPGVTIEHLTLVGTSGPRFVEAQDPQCQAIGGCTLPSLSINGPRARIYNNDITNGRGICINTSSYGGLTPDRFDIERNRIHDCKPADNHVHGIYIGEGAYGLIKDNVIFDNGDRGIQLYPNATRETVAYNTVDGNRTNIELGGKASGNIIERNILSFPSTSANRAAAQLRSRFNIEGALIAPASGNSNVVRDNCTYTAATGYFGGSPPHSGIAVALGIEVLRTTVAPPRYANRTRHDFTPAKGSACVGFGASSDVTRP